MVTKQTQTTANVISPMQRTHHMVLEWLQQLLQKSFVREERTLVQVFLSQVKIVMHGLHEGTEKVHTRETDTVIITFDGTHNLLANNLTKAAVCACLWSSWSATFQVVNNGNVLNNKLMKDCEPCTHVRTCMYI